MNGSVYFVRWMTYCWNFEVLFNKIFGQQIWDHPWATYLWLSQEWYTVPRQRISGSQTYHCCRWWARSSCTGSPTDCHPVWSPEDCLSSEWMAKLSIDCPIGQPLGVGAASRRTRRSVQLTGCSSTERIAICINVWRRPDATNMSTDCYLSRVIVVQRSWRTLHFRWVSRYKTWSTIWPEEEPHCGSRTDL